MLPTTRAEDGPSLRVWRQTHGLTLAQLGGALGVTWLSVQRWETGTHAVPPYLFLALREIERQLTDDEARA
jgi:transcriptional regulator with XRE-family HTH domain